MAVTIQYSDIVGNALAAQPKRNDGARDGVIKMPLFTQANENGDATSRQIHFELRANEILDVHQMHFSHSAFGAGRTLDVGHEGYTAPDGTVVAPAPAALATGIDVAAAGIKNVRDSGSVDQLGPFPVGVLISTTVQGGTIPIGATVNVSATVGQP